MDAMEREERLLDKWGERVERRKKQVLRLARELRTLRSQLGEVRADKTLGGKRDVAVSNLQHLIRRKEEEIAEQAIRLLEAEDKLAGI